MVFLSHRFSWIGTGKDSTCLSTILEFYYSTFLVASIHLCLYIGSESEVKKFLWLDTIRKWKVTPVLIFWHRLICLLKQDTGDVSAKTWIIYLSTSRDSKTYLQIFWPRLQYHEVIWGCFYHWRCFNSKKFVRISLDWCVCDERRYGTRVYMFYTKYVLIGYFLILH